MFAHMTWREWFSIALVVFSGLYFYWAGDYLLVAGLVGGTVVGLAIGLWRRVRARKIENPPSVDVGNLR